MIIILFFIWPIIIALIVAFIIAKKIYSISKPKGENRALVYSIIAFITIGGLIAYTLYYFFYSDLNFVC